MLTLSTTSPLDLSLSALFWIFTNFGVTVPSHQTNKQTNIETKNNQQNAEQEINSYRRNHANLLPTHNGSQESPMVYHNHDPSHSMKNLYNSHKNHPKNIEIKISLNLNTQRSHQTRDCKIVKNQEVKMLLSTGRRKAPRLLRGPGKKKFWYKKENYALLCHLSLDIPTKSSYQIIMQEAKFLHM